MSTARYSSGQKTVEDGGDGDAGPEEEPCACSVSVAEALPVRRVNQDFSPLNFFVMSLLPLLVLVSAVAPALAASQVPRG